MLSRYLLVNGKAVEKPSGSRAEWSLSRQIRTNVWTHTGVMFGSPDAFASRIGFFTYRIEPEKTE